MTRFRRTGTPADLDAAIALRHRATATRGPIEPARAVWLIRVAGALADRYARTRAVADLNEAIALGEHVLSRLPASMPEAVRAELRHALGMSLRFRFDHSGTPADVDAAVAHARRALHDLPADAPIRTEAMNALRQSLLNRFWRTGIRSDLDEAVELARQVVAAAPDDDPNHALYLANLGITLRTHFERTGNPADLDEAIQVGRAAIAAMSTDDPTFPERASSLGRALVDRFGLTGSTRDLDEAIRFARLGASAPTDSGVRAGRLTTLGVALRKRYERKGIRSDLDEAITVLREAVDAAPPEYSATTFLLMNLGNALWRRFESNSTPTDLAETIALFRRAVTETPPDHRERATMLSGLGRALRARYEQTDNPTDLDEAVTTLRQGADLTPTDHPDRAERLLALAAALMTRFWRAGTAPDRNEAQTAALAAARLEISPPQPRILAARAAADLLAPTHPQEAAALIATAIRLLPEVAPRQLERSDQQFAIGESGGFAADAAALTLRNPPVPQPDRATTASHNPAAPETNRADLALRLLEAGRAVLLGRTLQIRTDVTDLADQHPALAAEFVRLRDRLNDSGDSDRVELARAFERTLTRIRSEPGFETFALPPSTEQLRAQATDGPVIAFSVSDYRSDALLLTADGIAAHPLPGLSARIVRERAAAFRAALHTADHGATGPERQAAQRHLTETLEWLWDNAIGPVLDALGYREPIAHGQPGPRIWLSPGGLLGQLPLHAAGYHTRTTDSEARTVLDRVVPSYTPTVAALGYARQRLAATDPAAPPRGLVVAMPTTPGVAGRLHHVLDEARLVAAHLPGATVLTEPTTATVLDFLSNCGVAHFACHGATDPDDPSLSRLLLRDDATSPLTVAALAPIHLDRARLAYLSACDTADGGTRLVDESLHLASAFQLAGYPHVIGTLWTIDDGTASDIADTFYTGLHTAPATLDVTRAPYALHHAIRTARDDLPATPSLWAAHLHTGA
ncbi:CHAT domain-containing protein [Nocardia sp. NPDC004068]|uniref:CHAT domain-containing tetratricopeptide repeat protein n=1 Tax=Nocardia sp. NPDC004068 TaxID=3364303 RepID=UPI003690EE91